MPPVLDVPLAELVSRAQEQLLAQQACFAVNETPSPEGLRELGKKINLVKGRDFRASVECIHRHGMLVVGSFIIGLDAD